MTNEEMRRQIVSRYAELDSDHKNLLLVRIGEWFTMVGRDTYGEHEDVVDTRRLRIVNEAVHRILVQLQKMLASNDRRYPDDVFANIVADQVQALGVDEATLRRLLM